MAKRKIDNIIGLKIEKDRPEDSPRNIAIKIASKIQEEIHARNDSREFKAQAARERQKAKELGNVLILLDEYLRKKKKAIDSGEEWKSSRMEPMESYDRDGIKKERGMLLDRAKELDDLANNFDKMANDAKNEVLRLQKKLKGAK